MLPAPLGSERLVAITVGDDHLHRAPPGESRSPQTPPPPSAASCGRSSTPRCRWWSLRSHTRRAKSCSAALAQGYDLSTRGPAAAGAWVFRCRGGQCRFGRHPDLRYRYFPLPSLPIPCSILPVYVVNLEMRATGSFIPSFSMARALSFRPR